MRLLPRGRVFALELLALLFGLLFVNAASAQNYRGEEKACLLDSEKIRAAIAAKAPGRDDPARAAWEKLINDGFAQVAREQNCSHLRDLSGPLVWPGLAEPHPAGIVFAAKGKDVTPRYLAIIKGPVEQFTCTSCTPQREKGAASVPRKVNVDRVGICRRTVIDTYTSYSCPVSQQFKLNGPTGSDAVLTVDIADAHPVRIDFTDKGNYLRRVESSVDKGQGFDEGIVTFDFGGTVSKGTCQIRRSADYDNNFSSATGHNGFCIPKDMPALVALLKSHWNVSITLQVNKGIWKGGLSLEALPDGMVKAESDLSKIKSNSAKATG